MSSRSKHGRATSITGRYPEETIDKGTLVLLKEKENKCTVKELEDEIFLVENVRVVFRTQRTNETVHYPYKKKAYSNTRLSSFINYRIKKVIDSRYNFEIIDGYGKTVGDGNYDIVGELRDTYTKREEF